MQGRYPPSSMGELRTVSVDVVDAPLVCSKNQHVRYVHAGWSVNHERNYFGNIFPFQCIKPLINSLGPSFISVKTHEGKLCLY